MRALTPTMSWQAGDAPGASPCMLLAGFAAFYEEVASIRRLQQEGRLGASLELAVDASGAEYAGRVRARLLALLRQQHHDFQQGASVAQIKAHRAALYVMAALADEIFLLELDWPGADSWVLQTIEQKMFNSARAGQAFFELADRLLASHQHEALHADLASVLLLALQLGFKGEHRGRHGLDILQQYRQRLAQLAQFAHAAAASQWREGGAPPLHALQDNLVLDEWGRYHLHQSAFAQAYQQLCVDGRDQRLASLRPWRRWLKWTALAYLLVSTLLWLLLLYPVDALL